jgi:hypothetical protein
MDHFDRFRRYLGIPVPYSMIFVVNVLGDLWTWVTKYLSEPEVLKRKLAERKEVFLETDAADRGDLCDRLAHKGRLVLEMRALHGKYAWDRVLAELRVSRRTASNYTALYLFSVKHDALYRRFRNLGPTKLYRLARVAPFVLKDVTLATLVPTQDGPIELGKATDRQLESYLRATFPPKRRTREEKLRDAAKKIVSLTAGWPDGEPVTGDTIEMASGAVRKAAQLLSTLSTLPVVARAAEPPKRGFAGTVPEPPSAAPA